ADRIISNDVPELDDYSERADEIVEFTKKIFLFNIVTNASLTNDYFSDGLFDKVFSITNTLIHQASVGNLDATNIEHTIDEELLREFEQRTKGLTRDCNRLFRGEYVQ
ncbi:MAG: hypothetical protein AAGL49_13535, partial [Pseudomonadota bacterium]